MKLKTGDLAPGFELLDDSGRTVSLVGFKGKWLILYFYPKDNTSGCTLEARDFSCLVTEFSTRNAIIVGVSADSRKSHLNFREKHELKIILLSDPEHEVISLYDCWRMKNMYGREFMGIIRSTFLIDPQGRIVWIWDNVKTKGHAEKVLAKLAEFIQK